MNLKKKLSVGILSSLVLLIASACGNNQSKQAANQKISWSTGTEVTSIDPSKGGDPTSANQINQVMEGLYYLGKNSTPHQALAVKSNVSKNGKTWTFNLRKNAKWSNGDPVTAKDFVYAWRRTVSPKTGSEFSYIYSGIDNADKIMAGKKKVNTLGVKADGNYKLKVTLEKPIPYFKLLMATPIFYPQNQKAVAKYGKKYGTASKYMVYNGPFVQKGWDNADSSLNWKMVKNNHYWDKDAVKLKQINWSVQKTSSTAYNLYQQGKLDATSLDAEQSKQLKNKKGYTIIKRAQSQYMIFNTKKSKLYRNVNFRQAMSAAINRKDIPKVLGNTYESISTLTPTGLVKVNGKDYTDLVQDAGTKKTTTYNKQLAKKLFNKALKEENVSKVDFTLLVSDGNKQLAEYLQSQLQTTFGNKLTIHVSAVPFKTQLSRVTAGKYEASIPGWTADYSDPIDFLNLLYSNSSTNYSKWSNKEYDKLIDRSQNTQNEQKRIQYLVKAEKILISQAGVIPLYQTNAAWMINPNVKGVINNTTGAANYFKYAYLK